MAPRFGPIEVGATAIPARSGFESGVAFHQLSMGMDTLGSISLPPNVKRVGRVRRIQIRGDTVGQIQSRVEGPQFDLLFRAARVDERIVEMFAEDRTHSMGLGLLATLEDNAPVGSDGGSQVAVTLGLQEQIDGAWPIARTWRRTLRSKESSWDAVRAARRADSSRFTAIVAKRSGRSDGGEVSNMQRPPCSGVEHQQHDSEAAFL